MALRANTRSALIGPLLLAGCGGAAAHPASSSTRLSVPVTYADYPALRRPGPSGIGLITPTQARAAAAGRARPLWVMRPARGATGRLAQTEGAPTGAVPDIASAREVGRRGRARLWIARSSTGGVCVLSFRPELAADPSRFHAVSAACGSADGLACGATQIERAAGRGGPWFVSGVVPRGVLAVALQLAGGSERTVLVADNAYSASVERPVEGLAFVTGGVRH
jgi:hypothetical protein